MVKIWLCAWGEAGTHRQKEEASFALEARLCLQYKLDNDTKHSRTQATADTISIVLQTWNNQADVIGA
jgi:hypothetical protein